MDFYTLVYYSTFISPIILLGGIIVGIYYFKRLDILRKIIAVYIFTMFVTDILARFIGIVYGNNLILIPIYGALELSMFSIFYYFLGIKDNLIKKIILFLILISSFVFTFWEAAKVYNLPITQFQSYSKVISTLMIVLLSISFFLEKIYLKKDIKSDIFLLNSGVLLFYSLNLIIFLPIDFLINDNSGLKFYFWFANLIFTLIFYTFLILSVWKNGRIRE